MPGAPSAHLPYADLAMAPVDEAENPALHRTRASVEPGASSDQSMKTAVV
ncbi:hypothetical protein [Streptomyces sp. NPDC051286]